MLMEPPATDNMDAVDTGQDGLPVTSEDSKPAASLWGRLAGWLWGRNEKPESRLDELNWAIEHHPESPSAHVLRGEVYLEMGMHDRAAEDFSHALEYAAEQVENNDWGLIAQAVEERAATGLREAEYRLQAAQKHKWTGD